MNAETEPRAARPRRRARYLLAAGSILCTLLVAEWALRVVECRRCNVTDFAQVRERYLGNKLAIFPADESRRKDGLVPGKEQGGMRINRHGFRGAEVPVAKLAGTVRVVCLGGSSVFGTGSTGDSTTWPALLERELRATGHPEVEVLNGGVPAFRSAESIERFQELFLQFKPDVAILCNEHNDLLYRRMFRLTYDPRTDVPVPITNGLERALSHSAIYLKLRGLMTLRAKQRHLAEAVAAADKAKAEGRKGWDRKAEEKQQALAEEQRAEVVRYHADRDLEDYRASLERFVALCRANNCTPVLATELLSFRLDAGPAVYAEKAQAVLAQYMPRYEPFRAAYEAYHEVIRSTARQHGLPLLDADAEMPRAPENFTDHVHLSDAGCAQLARIFARQLVESKALGPPR